MFARGGFQLLDGIFTNPLVYIVNRDITHQRGERAVPGESVLFRISVTFMIATRRFLFPRGSHAR
jgi:hypothetical protein